MNRKAQELIEDFNDYYKDFERTKDILENSTDERDINRIQNNFNHLAQILKRIKKDLIDLRNSPSSSRDIISQENEEKITAILAQEIADLPTPEDPNEKIKTLSEEFKADYNELSAAKKVLGKSKDEGKLRIANQDFQYLSQKIGQIKMDLIEIRASKKNISQENEEKITAILAQEIADLPTQKSRKKCTIV